LWKTQKIQFDQAETLTENGIFLSRGKNKSTRRGGKRRKKIKNFIMTYYEQKALKILSFHIGGNNPITGKHLAEKINLPECGKEGANMRAIIHQLRLKGWPICASDRGYFLARTKEELTKFIISLEKRIKSQKEVLKGLHRAFDRVGIDVVKIPKFDEEKQLKEMAQQGFFG